MRHLNAGKRLGLTTSHRKALMRNLVTSLLEHGEIKTTVTRAKEMRKYFDKMIGLGKKNNLHARRQALAFINSKEAIQKLF
ncbi:50S ribosomal protein L17, partial [bacterium]|nr:50S ribosomal protein L17 [bacterium]